MRELTVEQIEFLKILECFMHENHSYKLPEETALPELYALAIKQNVAGLVYEVIRQDAMLAKAELQQLAVSWKRLALRDAMVQIQKTEGFLRIYRKLREAGLKPLVVKGIICRNMYFKPDVRVSSDEDMLLRREEFQECDEILRREGFSRSEMSFDSPAAGEQNRDASHGNKSGQDAIDLSSLPDEIPYINPQTGVYIELHLSLFPEESGAYGHLNQEFRDVFDTCISENIQNTEVWTLSPTKHLFYLVCHSFKHFLHSGFGVRQLCDMVMMAERYGEQIDWAYLKRQMTQLRMIGFWDGLADIGQKYLGFSLEKACYLEDTQKTLSDGIQKKGAEVQHPQVDSYDLLMDMLVGGVFGDSSMERKRSSNVTLAAVQSGKKDTAASLKASLFPGMSYMKTKYKWLERFPFLLPVAWVLRVINYLQHRDKKAAGESSIEIGMERVELLRKYGIIE